MKSRFGMAATCCTLALALTLCAGTAFAQGSEMKGGMMGEGQGKQMHQPNLMPMMKTHKAYLGNMAEVNGLLEAAQKALQAGDTDTASAKITEAQNALKKRYEAVQKHMMMQIQKAKESGNEEAAAALEEAWQDMSPAGKGKAKSK